MVLSYKVTLYNTSMSNLHFSDPYFKRTSLIYIGSDTVYATEPDFKDLCLFYEYFHGDTGRGCGARYVTRSPF